MRRFSFLFALFMICCCSTTVGAKFVDFAIENDLPGSQKVRVFLTDRPGCANRELTWPIEVDEGKIDNTSSHKKGKKCNMLFSYRYQGQLYQYRINKKLHKQLNLQLSNFELQEQDNYPYVLELEANRTNVSIQPTRSRSNNVRSAIQ